MTSPVSWSFSIALGLAALVGIGVTFSLRQEARVVRGELERAKVSSSELANVERENRRLKAQHVSSAELEGLRADHDAVVRLRKEVEELQRTAERGKQALATARVEPRYPQGSGPTLSPAAVTLTLLAGDDGKVALQGAPVDASVLRQGLAALPRGSRFEILLRVPKPQTSTESAALKAGIDQTMKTAAEIAKELGLSMSVRMESSIP